ncbi:hypothetical protein O6H91_19G064600 [Diphasiastrum complanatum]|uniref:Uncharacterized protein n=15 Tax=Diphasiastrum complanatum TaxID=34168 RepID=A0ACC2AW19_DIPCM|nr:hypothetical protein O6H91_19G064600 [Diphasiastrum complanatum]KAJ7521703.1 hypothetical protein O6H91_19G064600 [Diphasiastrum complanatum]KAJ7521704.1 hypothetical protein O6H91_19G064600 [Diphasiastrum complanatum]KAJ7521705.1 hypothetical protein O6H91_19G064600 [Diphasiastrum complanatum]KAJ7521706.1 hypothetical protein O6H91_19G064600 [Diphasiastrum complanatum]
MGLLGALQPFNQVVDCSQKSAKTLPGMLLQQLLLCNQNVMHGFCIYGGLADNRKEIHRNCTYEMCCQQERFKEIFLNESWVRYESSIELEQYERSKSWTEKLHRVKDNYWYAHDQEDVSGDNQDGDCRKSGNKSTEEENDDENDGDEDNWNAEDGSYDYNADENNQDGEDDDKQYSAGDGDDDPDEDSDKDYNFEEDNDQDEDEDEDDEDGYEDEDYGNDAEIVGPISHSDLHGTAEQLKLNLGFKTATESNCDNTEEETWEDDYEDSLESPGRQNWHAETDPELETVEDYDQDLWNKEFQKYLDQKPEFRARLQYQVRCILIVPAFEAGGCSVSAFEQFYRKKFRRGIKATGFSTAARLCRAMPHVVQRRLLDEERKLYLVESSKNFRVVAGIRSGLRRIVYDIVKLHSQGLLVDEFVQECSRVMGRPLATVLTELAYGTPNVDSMIRDMLDIISLRNHGSENSKIFLCRGAEDPALTDGILLDRTWDCLTQRNPNSYFNESEQCHLPKATKAADAEVEMLDGCEEQVSAASLEGSGNVSDGCLEHIIVKDYAFSSNLGDENLNGSDICLPFSEDESFLQARFKLRVLLAVCTSGIKLSKLEEAYEKMFSLKLNLNTLGCSSIIDLANSWQDIIVLSDTKPECAYLLPSKDNMRILQTLRSGLRLTIFSFLLVSYPEGMDSCEFLSALQQSLSDDLWDTFVAEGYITDAARKPFNYSFISKNEDFHVTYFAEFCLMLHDMVDFIRLGCQDNGSLMIKLRGTNFPVLDFPEESLNFDFDQTIQLHEHSEEESPLKNKCFSHSKGLTTKHGLEEATRLQNVSLAKSKSFPSPTLKHQVRLILGSPKYNGCALSLYEFCTIFKERTGKNLHLNGYKDVKSLMDAMPDVVSRDSLRAGRLKLSKTCQNQRIIAATKAGLRQILYWALLKNSGGLWVELLEGWYSDFAGSSLGLKLYKYGYRGSRKGLVSPVFTFLEDMVDLMNKYKIDSLDMYNLAGRVDDPVPADALLLGLSSDDIQYNPLRDVFGAAYTNDDNNKLQSTLRDVDDKSSQRGASTSRH